MVGVESREGSFALFKGLGRRERRSIPLWTKGLMSKEGTTPVPKRTSLDIKDYGRREHSRLGRTGRSPGVRTTPSVLRSSN